MHAISANIDAFRLPGPVPAARCAVTTTPFLPAAQLSGIDAVGFVRGVEVLRALILSLALILGLPIIVG